MRKHFLFLFLALISANIHQGQTRTTKVGYIDMEYILQNVSDYTEAKAQLELKAQKWKEEIETKKNNINSLKDGLKAERALLTKELIEERETEIKFLETELLDFQQKQFGVNGNLMLQKAALAKPIQDQVFTAVQDIAEAKKYDFIFDRSSDLTMLFAAKRFDISDQVLRVITRADKRDQQLTKKQLELEEAEQAKLDAIEENPALSERQKLQEERKLAREKLLAERKLAQEQKVKEYEDRKKAIAAEREAKKNGTISETQKTEVPTNKAEPNKTAATTTQEKEVEEETTKTAAETKAEERQRLYEQRKKELEERRQKILQEREAAKKAKEVQTTVPNSTN